MTRKILTYIGLLLFAATNTNIFAQDSIFVSKHKFEVGLNYAIQQPYYSLTTPADIIEIPHQSRYRSRIGADIKYYVFNKWFFEFQTALSQEGGGFKEQYTNANYWKNGIYVGFCSNHNRRIIFDIYTGLDFNLLLNAKFKNNILDKSENVSDYYNRFVKSFPVFGLGLKTKIHDNLFIRAGVITSITDYKISPEENTYVSQVIFPAFQISLTRYLK